MSAFEQALKARATVPEATIDLPPEAFAESFTRRPATPVRLGLKRMCADLVQTAKAEAASRGIDMHPNDLEGQISSYNETLMCWCIVGGLCDPEDSEKPPPFFGKFEANVRSMLTPSGMRWLWDQVELHHIVTGPIVPEATDDEIQLLAMRLLERPLPESFDKGQEMRARKLLNFVLQEIFEKEPDLLDAPFEGFPIPESE